MTGLDEIRSAGEEHLAEIMRSLDERHRDMLREAIKRYGRIQDVPESVWRRIVEDTQRETVTALYLLMLAADGWMIGQIQSQSNRLKAGPVDERGYKIIATGRSAALATQRMRTTRDRLARTIEDKMLDRSRGGLGELTDESIDDAIDDVLTPERRSTAATNETTGSMSAGQIGGRDRFAPGNLRDTAIDLIWRTERDNLVCPRCSPLEGSTEDVWGRVFPDGPGEQAHPNCRCELEPRVRALENSEAA